MWKCPLNKVLQSGGLATLIHHYRNKYGKIDALVELRRDVTAERELEREILRRHNHLDALSRISFAVSGLWGLEAILNVALDTVLQVFSGTVGGFCFSMSEFRRCALPWARE